MVQARIAYTTNSNSPESDMQKYVKHTVEGTVHGVPFEVEVMASDPIDALNRVDRMSVDTIVSINKLSTKI